MSRPLSVESAEMCRTECTGEKILGSLGEETKIKPLILSKQCDSKKTLSMSVVEQSYLYCCAEWNVKCSPPTISLEVLSGLSDVTSSHRRKKEEEGTTTSVDSLPGYLRIEEDDDDDDRLTMMAEEGRKESEVEFDHLPEEDIDFLLNSYFNRTTTSLRCETEHQINVPVSTTLMPLPMATCGKKRKHVC